MIMLILLSLISAAADLMLAGFIYAEDREDPLHLIGALRCATIGGLFLCTVQFTDAPSAALAQFWLQTLVISFAAVAFQLHMIWIWLGGAARPPRRGALLALYGSMLIMVLINIWQLPHITPTQNLNGQWTVGGLEAAPLLSFGLVWVCAVILLTIGELLRFWRSAGRRGLTRPTHYLMAGTILPLVLIFLTDLLPRLLGIDLPILSPIWGLLGSTLVVYGIHKAHTYLLTPASTGRSIFRTIAQGAVMVDCDDTIAAANPAFCALVGREESQVVGVSLHSLLLDAPADLRAIDQLRDAPIGLRTYDGVPIPVLISIAAIHDRRGGELGHTVLFTDISSRVQIEREALRLATTDVLTGLFNRRQVVALASRIFADAQRDGTPLTLLLLDIDHFKQFNTRYGYSVGDRVLCAVADAIAASLRSEDLLGRYGGEEFLMLLPNTVGDDARQIAERVRRAIATIESDGFGAPHITASIGSAFASPSDIALEHLIDRADLALRHAKLAGRDRLASWDQLESTEAHTIIGAG